MRSLPSSFEEALRALALWFESDNVPYTTVGGLAVSLLGRPRATQDIDVVIWLGERSWEAFLRAGEDFGFEGRIADVLEFAERSRVILLRHAASGISVDISCGALPFESEMIERAQMLEAGGVRVKVPTPEDLIVMKAVARRSKDLDDIEALLRAHQALDLDRVRYWVGEFAAALETPEILDGLERLLARRTGS
ncbi:MAG: nucleotidyl transferase AbiEii/AbiGii toxin family protein [Acidobacteria bacterium]|nr:nucleotidyl transferase AbiEii/AbiGii toxin family protein [Acidobacteriota bacterium]